MKREYRALAQPGVGVEKLLGELEREVMDVLWARGSGSVRDVLERLNAERPAERRLAYTTVMTVMMRLAEKGLLARRLVGKAHEYEAAQSREAFVARASRDLAQQMVQDFGEAAIAGFLAVLEDVAPGRLENLRGRVRPRGDA